MSNYALLMVRPSRFGFNAETAVNNAFQVAGDQSNVQEKALQEFDHFVQALRDNHIDVLVVQDTEEPHTPDSIFPNNWISFHKNSTIVLYPMFAENRRLERKESIMDAIRSRYNIDNTIDLTKNEAQDIFLEGTGSIILDRKQKIAYANISPRTDKNLFKEFCEEMGYEPVIFEAKDEHGKDIYHTNVMMCVGDRYAVICLDCIPEAQREGVREALENSGKTIITISYDQMNHFAGNMLQVENTAGEKFLVMSTQAYESLSPEQVSAIENFNPIIHVPLYTIEQNGGGSARCMMAEILLPKK
ncbi:citrulline utilization hydrolase CtlX [Edaphocola flava]|uniref:citrulline utilization hydrolase CtlX n=1 Tax=Edaphocola flava TaxID=2499629 RepID=UPI001F47A17C|nr:arginine deiminase-related protein [Edaphocola flava]